VTEIIGDSDGLLPINAAYMDCSADQLSTTATGESGGGWRQALIDEETLAIAGYVIRIVQTLMAREHRGGPSRSVPKGMVTSAATTLTPGRDDRASRPVAQPRSRLAPAASPQNFLPTTAS
jgi:hypothetical protein